MKSWDRSGRGTEKGQVPYLALQWTWEALAPLWVFVTPSGHP